jgi:transglutaminase-like putative cysteine protease
MKLKGLGRESVRDAALFLLRNVVLYFFLVNAWLQLREGLSILYQCAAFAIGAVAAVWMEKGRLRFLPALLLSAALPAVLRAVFFLVFRLQRSLAPGPGTDFLFFLFDKDFLPALVPYAVAWLFNFLALRRRAFVFVETGLNSLLLVLVFWTQAGYRLSLYSHPSIFANALAAFVVAEIVALMLAWTREAGKHGERITWKSLLSFSWIVLPLLLVFMFFLLGKYSEGAVAAGGGLMKPTLFRFDFAPFIRLESEIRVSDETVMLFRTKGEADRWLLKRFVLSGYDPNRGFFMEKGKGIDEYPSTVPDSRSEFPDPGYREREDVEQEYFFITLDPSSLIAVDYPVTVVPLVNWKSSSFLRVYRVLSRSGRSEINAAMTRDAPPLPRDVLEFYSRGGDDPEIKELAETVTEGTPGYYGKVKDIERYLRDNYLYSLKPGIAEDGNQLRHFLFESKKGYCSYFAFAMALMCRSLGIPARVAVGFFVDPEMEVLNFYEVRAFQAHAWVEVYFGDLGWIQFDPTSENLAPGEQFNFFMGPDKDTLARLIREILRNQDSLEEEQAEPTPPSVASVIGTGIARAFWLLARLWYAVLPLLFLLYLFSVKLLPSLPGLLLPDGRRAAKSAFRLSLVRLYGIGAVRRSSESIKEYAGRMESEKGIELSPLAERYLKSVFGESFNEGDAAAMRGARALFLRSYRSRVKMPLRVLGALNPHNALRRKI